MAKKMRRIRGISSNQYLVAAVVVAAVSFGGLGLFYYHANSPRQLSIKAQIAMDNGDSTKAVEYLKRAMDRNPTGEMGAGVRKMLARALIEAGRESDARPYLEQVLAQNSSDTAALDILALTYTHPAQRKLDQSPKPLSDLSLADIYGSIDEGIASLEKMPQTPRNQIAQSQLHRLYYVLMDDQIKRTKAAIEDAHLAQDPPAEDKARQKLAAMKDPAQHRDQAIAQLQAALKQDPQNIRAAEFLVQYQYQDRRFPEALALYRQFQKTGPMSQELVISAANSIISDAQTQPDYRQRYAAAQKELETYQAAHDKDPGQAHLLVAIGLTLVEQGKFDDAMAMAQKAIAVDAKNLDAQLLLINCKVRQKKDSEALSLITPLTNTNSSVPQVWYLLGLVNADMGNLKPAEESLRKSLALNGGYTPARRALLVTLVRAGNNDAAGIVASQEIHEDRYFIPAWSVAVEDFRKRGQGDRAKVMLLALAADPDLPSEARPDLVQLLLENGMAASAQKVAEGMPANDDDTLRVRAAVAAANGNLTAARDMLSKTIERDPGNVEARLDYVELLLRSDLAPDARAQLDQLAAMYAKLPANVVTLNHMARDYLTLRLPEQAIAMTHQALAVQPANDDAKALQQQATVMLTGVTPTAPKTSAEPASAADALRMAVDALDRKDYKATLSLAREGLSRDSSNIALHHVAARALAGLGQRDAAVEEVISAARTQPDVPASFAVFVELFPTPDEALKGLGYGNSLQAINPALANWAMGRLAEAAGDAQPAMRYYKAGLEAVSKTAEPGAARDVLYRAILALDAKQNDAAALQRDADSFAAEPTFTIGVRVLAADHLRIMGDAAGVVRQLEELTKALTPASNPQVTLAVAQRFLAVNRADRAQDLVEKQLSASEHPSPELLDALATMVQGSNPDKALKIRQQLVALDPSNPRYRVGLASAQAMAGDEPGAFHTLDDLQNLGQTGKELATSARLRLLTNLGLLKEATAALAAAHNTTPSSEDFASMLAIGQGWMKVGHDDDARKMLAGIPPYAAEYPSAAAEIASLDSAAGDHDAAIKILKDAMARAGKNLPSDNILAPALFQTYLRAGKAPEAMALSKQQSALFAVNTPPYRNWIVLAATAAREGGNFDEAVALLESLDPDSRKVAAADIAILHLLNNKPNLALMAANTVSNTAPNFAATTLQLMAGAPPAPLPETQVTTLLSTGLPSTVYAALSALTPEQQKSHIADIAKNPRVIPGDVETLLAQIGPAGTDASTKLRQLALSQRLLEISWSTSCLAVLDRLDKATGTPLTIAQIQRFEALNELQRSSQAKPIVDGFAAELKADKPVPPGVRIVLASQAAAADRNEEAIAALEPLASLNRPALLTTIAGFHEKLGQLDKAVALNLQVKNLEPDNLLAANNLAYTLCASDPTNKSALARAASTIQPAIDKAPQVPAFQDTLGWIEILSGKASDGTRRIARALPSLRLNAAVHYHLGIGYSKTGQPELARMHLQNVQYLAKNQPIPELALAGEALKTLAAEK